MYCISAVYNYLVLINNNIIIFSVTLLKNLQGEIAE
jgi:hypothetical protein